MKQFNPVWPTLRSLVVTRIGDLAVICWLFCGAASVLSHTNTNQVARPALNAHQIFYQQWKAANDKATAHLSALTSHQQRLRALAVSKDNLAKGSGASERKAAMSMGPAIDAANKQVRFLSIQRQQYELKYPAAVNWSPNVRPNARERR